MLEITMASYLKYYAGLSILGDAFIAASGMRFESIFRIASSVVGISGQVAGLRGEDSKTFGIDTTKVTMGGTAGVGLFYMLSAIFESHRFAEATAGALLVIGAGFFMNGRSKTGSNFFQATTMLMFASGIESMWRQNEIDWLILAATMCYFTGNYIASKIKPSGAGAAPS